jgi:hypothetical protein
MLYSFVCIIHKTRKLILLKLVLHELYSEASVVYGICWVVNAVIKLSLKLFTWFSLVRWMRASYGMVGRNISHCVQKQRKLAKSLFKVDWLKDRDTAAASLKFCYWSQHFANGDGGRGRCSYLTVCHITLLPCKVCNKLTMQYYWFNIILSSFVFESDGRNGTTLLLLIMRTIWYWERSLCTHVRINANSCAYTRIILPWRRCEMDPCWM